jgi:hypothetical protein
VAEDHHHHARRSYYRDRPVNPNEDLIAIFGLRVRLSF